MTKIEQYREQKEREKQRREKRNKRLSQLAVIFMIVVVLGGLLYYFCVWGAWSYYSKGEECVLDQETKKVLELVSADTHISKNYGDLALLCDKNSVNAYEANGELKWSVSIAVSEPVVDVCGKYILVADRKGKSVYIIKNGKLILEYETKYNISNASINKYGSFITVTEEDSFKNLVSLRDVSGKEMFVWHSANSYVVDASVNSAENSIMLTTLTTQIMPDGRREYVSGMKVFDVGGAKEITSVDYEDDIAASVYSAGGGYIVVSGKTAIKYSEKGEEKKRYDFGGKCGKLAFDNNRLAVVVIDSEYKNSIVILDDNLSVVSEKKIEKSIDALDFDSGVVSYVADDEIYMCKTNLDVRYRIKTDKLYSDVELFVRGKRALVINEGGAAVIETK